MPTAPSGSGREPNRKISSASLQSTAPPASPARHDQLRDASRNRTPLRMPLPPQRRDSSASLASTATGGTMAVGTRASIAEVNEYSQNAISTLLAPPIVRTGMVAHTSLPPSSQHRPPTIRDIPPVTLTSIPHVENSVFKSYLSTVGSLYETLQRVQSANDDPASASDRDSTATAGEETDYFRPPLQRRPPRSPAIRSPRRDSSASISSLPQPSPMSPRRPSSARRDTNQLTPLSTIPNVYFDEDFHLENPRTFDIVSEKAEIIAPSQPSAEDVPKDSANAPVRRKALHMNAILQEKLSWYMDTVEVHLIQSIATASTSFFTALGSLKDLQAENDETLVKVRGLQQVLQELDKGMAVGGLEIASLKRRRENLRKLSLAVSQLCDIVENAKACEDLVDQGKFDEAATGLVDLEKNMAGEASSSEGKPAQLLDLRQLKALDGLSDGILELRTRIGRGHETRFLDALLGDLRHHVQAVPTKTTLQRWAAATFRSRGGPTKPPPGLPAYMETNEKLRPELVAALAGLSRAGHTARAAAAYRESILKEIKSLIRRHLPSSSDDDNESMASMSTVRGSRKLNQQEKSAILARNLRALEPETAEEMLIKTFTAVGEALRRLGYQVKVLLDVTYSMEQPRKESNPRSPTKTTGRDIGEEVSEALDLSSLSGQAVDLTQAQVVKVLKVRSEQSSRLPLDLFVRYFVLNRLFIDECEAISSRPGDVMKEIINSHVREFLFNFADTQRASITQTLDADKWEVTEITSATQATLGRVLEGLNSTPKEWMQYSALWESDLDSILPDSNTNGTAAANGATDASSKVTSVTIDGQRYMLVGSAIGALRGLDQFLNLIATIPFLTVDASQRLLDYLKLFNSRAVQLILGAGATRSAGLKNITTKHLALASQTCSFIVALIPYAREFVRRSAPSAAANVLPEFDRVKRLFQDHQTSIHDKLVEIMSQRCAAHTRAFRQVQFDDDGGQSQADQNSPYVEALAKETGTLYRVLAKHVSDSDLRMVMIPIFGHYKSEWEKALRETIVKTEQGKQRLLRDMEFFASRIEKMEGANQLGPELIEVVKNKKVTAPPSEQSTKENGKDDSKEDQTSVDSGTETPKPEAAPAVSTLAVDDPQPKTSIEILGSGKADSSVDASRASASSNTSAPPEDAS